MGRKTIYNNITSAEKLKLVNPDNLELERDFLDYLVSVDRSKGTIVNYKSDLEIFWCWNLENNRNKFFIDLSKRDVAKFQNYAMTEWKWSPKRIRRVKATLSSLSNYIENVLDDEYEGYRPIIRKIENPADATVRDKTIFTQEELEYLLHTLVNAGRLDQACMLSLAMNNGRRKSELPRMKVNYFDKENLCFGGSLYKTPEEVTTKGRGSRGKPLTIYTLARPFQPYLDAWMDYRKHMGIESEWLIPKCLYGVYVDQQVPISVMNDWAAEFSGILGKPFYWHSLRHYFTTFLAASNIPDSVIQTIIGWDSADMCKIYNDASADQQLSKFFGEEGIKSVAPGSFSSI